MGDIPFWVTQLAYQAPTLLVSGLGLILGLVYRSRCPVPALMTILGCSLLFLTAIGYTAAFTMLMERRSEGELTNERFARLTSSLGMVSTCARAIGMGLVVVAVFVGRSGARRPSSVGA